VDEVGALEIAGVRDVEAASVGFGRDVEHRTVVFLRDANPRLRRGVAARDHDPISLHARRAAGIFDAAMSASRYTRGLRAPALIDPAGDRVVRAALPPIETMLPSGHNTSVPAVG